MGSKKTESVNAHFDEEDWSLLVALAETEKLPKPEIIRRAVRLYAESNGVAPGANESPEQQAAAAS